MHLQRILKIFQRTSFSCWNLKNILQPTSISLPVSQQQTENLRIANVFHSTGLGNGSVESQGNALPTWVLNVSVILDNHYLVCQVSDSQALGGVTQSWKDVEPTIAPLSFISIAPLFYGCFLTLNWIRISILISESFLSEHQIPNTKAPSTIKYSHFSWWVQSQTGNWKMLQTHKCSFTKELFTILKT